MTHFLSRINLRSIRGNTIIEVMIAILIIGTVMTALAATMTYSVKNTSEAQYRDIATTLASEPIEVLRHLRSTSNWKAFYDAMPDGSRCITTGSDFKNASELGNLSNGNFWKQSACVDDIDSFAVSNGSSTISFFRNVTILRNDANKITVTSVVSWSRNDAVTSDVTLVQVFHNTGAR
jgi:Tfp pilus assembly protein PilV